MPRLLERFHQSRQLHYITFSCYQRRPYLCEPAARELVERTLERVRRWYDFYISAYVVMPEHLHLLMNEPARAHVGTAIQMLKQNVSREITSHNPFWYPRYYDFNLWSTKKFVEKIRYIHRNPLRRGLVQLPEEWAWSSFRHYATGVSGIVEIESQWTAKEREGRGIVPRITSTM